MPQTTGAQPWINELMLISSQPIPDEKEDEDKDEEKMKAEVIQEGGEDVDNKLSSNKLEN